jgi:DNA-binding protein HU-beta
LLVHIGDPPTNQAASLESQMIPTIQYVPGRALTNVIEIAFRCSVSITSDVIWIYDCVVVRTIACRWNVGVCPS